MLIANLVMLLGLFGALNNARVSTGDAVEYRLLATNKTSTMEKEMNQAAAEGFRFGGAMGGETAVGGAEMVVIMWRKPDADAPRYDYRLLATNKTSTMQKELSGAGEAGFLYAGQTVYNSAFGGREVVVILERSKGEKTAYEYRLLATNKTSTMQNEMSEASRAGYVFCGMTVAETSFGGREVVSIMRKQVGKELR
ncbi:MAG TPA: hypothetical protein VJZ77_01220 [Blastocatellia bacterium]|nr:hypothetical protein [Blastocatellia bacterium]